MGSGTSVEEDSNFHKLSLLVANYSVGNVEQNKAVEQRLREIHQNHSKPLAWSSIVDELKSQDTAKSTLSKCISWGMKGTSIEISHINKMAVEILEWFIISDKFERPKTYETILIESHSAIQAVNKLAIHKEDGYRIQGVRLLAMLVGNKDLQEKVEIINPINAFNLIAGDENSTKDAKLYALQGIKALCRKQLAVLLPRGVITTLSAFINNDKEDPQAVNLALECLEIACENLRVVNKLIEEEKVEGIKKMLSVDSRQVVPAARCLQAICAFQEGRAAIDQRTMKRLYEIAQNGEVVGKLTLLSLCQDEKNCQVFHKKGWTSTIYSVFDDTRSLENRNLIARSLLQLSKNCEILILSDFYKRCIPVVCTFLKDSDHGIRETAMTCLKHLIKRPDLHSTLVDAKLDSLLMDMYRKYDSEAEFKSITQLDIMACLCVLSNNSKHLLIKASYIQFCHRYADPGNEGEFKNEVVTLAALTLSAVDESYLMSNTEDTPDLKFTYVRRKFRAQNEDVRYRAVGTLTAMAKQNKNHEKLITLELIDDLSLLLGDNSRSVISQACKAIIAFTKRPESLEMWLKFDSAFVVDAANSHIPEITKEIRPLEKKLCMYGGWGMNFGHDDVIVINDMRLLEEWTLSVFIRLPLPKTEKNVLVQGRSGYGALILVKDHKLKIINQTNGMLVTLYEGFDKLQKGWHHLAVTYKFDDSVEGYVDGKRKMTKNNRNIIIQEPMKYFGNESNLKSPFGIICDLRLYSKKFSESQIAIVAKVANKIESEMPDKHLERLNRSGCIPVLIDLLNSQTECVKLQVIKAIANLATKGTCRAIIINHGGLNPLISCLKSSNPILQIHTSRALVNLA